MRRRPSASSITARWTARRYASNDSAVSDLLVVGIATHDNVIAANKQFEQEANQDRADD